MVAKKNFEIGDLVWAKRKCFPHWPAKIVKPPTDVKSASPKKAQHYVFFFGSENYAWIMDDNIVHHSDEMLQSTSNKKKSSSYKLAIEQITEESRSAPKKAKSPVKEKESPKKSPEVSTSSTERKIAKVQKIKVKTESPKVQKKTTPKRRFFDESANKRISPPRRLSKKPEDYSALISNTPPNIGYNRVAVIRPLDDHANSLCSSGFTRREFFELQPGPSLDLQKKSEAIEAKNIRATSKKIGFIGLGMMGQRLVKNLITSKHKVTVWNRTPEKCIDFVKVGAQLAQTPGDVVENCDIIFCCVSGPDASKRLVFGNCGILSGLERCLAGSKGYVEMTTIDPITSQEIAEAITHKGGRYLEASISGSRELAENGSLLILGSGDRELFTNCESCFFALSKNAYYLSCDVGSGSKMNLILSMLMGISHAALAEAMALVERCNLSQSNFLEILELGPLNSTLLSEKGQAMQSRHFETNTSLKYQQNDLNLALSLGNMCEQPMLLTAAANEFFKHAKLLRYSDHDVSALISNTPPNIGYNRVAVIRPLDDHANSLCSSGFTRREFFELQPGPSLDLQKKSEAIEAKNIRATSKKIGFIGLGMMGQRLVKNLITSKHKVTVWNRTPEKCIDFVKVGAQLAQTPGDVVEKCDIIFCCVSGPDASKRLVFGNCGILSGLERCLAGSKGYVEMTTIDPITSQEIAEAITHKGGRYLEASISGSRELAENGSLLILGSGDRELFTNCESCFFALSKNAYYLSCDVGSGSKMNLILSMLMGISHAALAEAMALVERCNLSQSNFLEILELGPLNSTLLSEKGQAMQSRHFETNTSLKYQQNDLNLALSLGNMCEQPMLLTAAANEFFKHAKLLRYSDHDVSAVYLGAKY